jgi:hypothetical protein
MDTLLKNTFKPAMTYGIALGIISVILSLFLYFFNIMPIGIVKPILLFVVQVAIYFVGILYFSKLVKNEVYGGTVDFRQALIIGVLIGFFTSIIISAYSYLQNVIIDPDYLARYMNAQAEWTIDFMYKKGVPEENIDDFIKNMDERKEEVYTFLTYIKSVAVSTLGFSVLSLITAAFIRTKKSSNPFAE